MTDVMSWLIGFFVLTAICGLVWLHLPMGTIKWIWPTAFDATPEQMAAGGQHPELIGFVIAAFSTVMIGWLLLIREAIQWWHERKVEQS